MMIHLIKIKDSIIIKAHINHDGLFVDQNHKHEHGVITITQSMYQKIVPKQKLTSFQRNLLKTIERESKDKVKELYQLKKTMLQEEWEEKFEKDTKEIYQKYQKQFEQNRNIINKKLIPQYEILINFANFIYEGTLLDIDIELSEEYNNISTLCSYMNMLTPVKILISILRQCSLT
ncbi:MAG: hypothetical protein LBE13_18025 [Bacteroidales bacterium]|jgi:hypothetical protein|nr:hypothetical protein [Bacteroidales bacterium]